MQSYKRAIGEVSVTISNAHYSCMSFCQFRLYIFMFVYFKILWYVILLSLHLINVFHVLGMYVCISIGQLLKSYLQLS